MRIKKYNTFLLKESLFFLKDVNLKNQLISMGVKDEDELKKQIKLSKGGKLGEYLHNNGDSFTFGILKAIFKDAKKSKIKMDARKAFWQSLPRTIPVVLAPFYPILAIVGLVFGTSRTFNKIIKPIFNNIDINSKYVDFLKTTIEIYMRVPEGDVDIKDRFYRAFVVTDRLIDALKSDVIDDFTNNISEKMELEPDNKEVPNHYIENELKNYLNNSFDIDPKIPTK